MEFNYGSLHEGHVREVDNVLLEFREQRERALKIIVNVVGSHMVLGRWRNVMRLA